MLSIFHMPLYAVLQVLYASLAVLFFSPLLGLRVHCYPHLRGQHSPQCPSEGGSSLKAAGSICGGSIGVSTLGPDITDIPCKSLSMHGGVLSLTRHGGVFSLSNRSIGGGEEIALIFLNRLVGGLQKKMRDKMMWDSVYGHDKQQ